MTTKTKKQIKPIIIPSSDPYSRISWLTSSDVIPLSLIPTTIRNLIPLTNKTPILETTNEGKVIKKSPIQAKVPVMVDDLRSYPSICSMMRWEGIQDKAKEGLDNNWSQIRRALKKAGFITWEFRDGRKIVISQSSK
jgi:hypothetical protein